MSLFARIFRFIWAVLWYSFAVTTVVVAAGFGLARLLLPMASQYSADVERKATEYAGQPVSVQGLDAEWHGFGPSLVLKGVRVLDKKGGKTIIQLSKVRLGLDLIGSLTQRQINFSSLTLIGADLSFVRREDGRITLSDFDMQSRGDEELANEDFLSRWIMGQGLLSVELKNLFFEDRMGKGRMFHFSNVTAMLRNAGERHLIDAIVSVPREPERKFALSTAIKGNPLLGQDWQADFYATGHRIDFGKLFGAQNFGGYYATLGESDFEFWGTWDHGQLAALKGEFVLQDLWASAHPPGKAGLVHAGALRALDGSNTSASQTDSVFYDQLTGRIEWRHNADGWHLQGDRFVVSRDGWLWPASAFDIDVQTTAQNKTRINASTSFMRVQDVLALQALFPAKQFPDEQVPDKNITDTQSPDTKDPDKTLASARPPDDTPSLDTEKLLQDIRHLSPSGDLKNVKLVWHQDRPEDFLLHGELDKGGLKAWGKIPGGKGIKAIIDARDTSGRIRFDTGKATIDMPALFRNEHVVDQLRGSVHWSFDQDAWAIASNELVVNTPDIDSKLTFELELPTGNRSPYLNLMAKFSNGDGSRAAQYFPAKIMHAKTVAWLDRAIVDGHVTSGGVIFHGNTHDFPFRKNQGVFEVRFNMEHGVLDYAPGWPRLENIDAEVAFHNESMLITSDNATIFNSGLSHVRVGIPDMGDKPLRLTVKGDVKGETREKILYLQSSPPLHRRFGKYLEKIHTTGSSDLGLDIEFRIGKDVFNADVNGVLAINDNTIKVDPLGTLLTRANGKIMIAPDGLRATDLTADLVGQSVQLKIDTQQAKTGASNINILAKGDFDAHDLSQRYAPELQDLVEGKAPWRVNANIPFKGAPAIAKDPENTAPSSIDVSVKSDLKGIESRLPAPFNKEKQRRITLGIESQLFSDQRNLSKVVLGGLLDGVLEVNSAGENPGYRGEIRFGGGPVALPKQSGLRLTGRLDDFNADIWRALVAGMGGNQQSRVGKPRNNNCCAWINSVDMSVSNMLLYGQTLSDLRLSAENKDERLSARLASKELAGKIVVPANLQTQPIELELDKLHLTSSSLSSEGSIDPRDIPAIKAFCKNVTFQKRKFGSVRLETTRLAEGLRLEQLVVKPKATTITANGSWVIEAGKQKSEFDLQLSSTDLGKTMNDLDYVGSIDGGKGTLNANILWPGPLTDVDLDHLQGHVALDFKNGRLLEVEAGGAGRRIFGLFSIQTLPRRLFLDFSDLFKKGFEFNEIMGEFNIQQGDAYTDDFTLDGPGVKTEMSGRIGLASQDYDQKVLVTPRVSDITALLTLLSSEPVLFIVQQLLRNKINQVASFEYHLSGPWENYKLEPVHKSTPKVSDDDDF